MTFIFISYSRKDSGFANQLAHSLAGLGADVWIDTEDIPAGMKWSSAIQQGLNQCEVMLVVISPDSMTSTNVEDEWQYFLDRHKLVVPILLRPADVHFQLSRLQYIDFLRQHYDMALAQLYSELARNGLVLPTVPFAPAATPHSPPAYHQPQPVPYRVIPPHGPASYGWGQPYGTMHQASLHWMVVIIINAVVWGVTGFVVMSISSDTDHYWLPFGIIGGIGGLALGFSLRAALPSVSVMSVFAGAAALAAGLAVLFEPNLTFLYDFIVNTLRIDGQRSFLWAYIGLRSIGGGTLLALAYSLFNPLIRPRQIRIPLFMSVLNAGLLTVAIWLGFMAWDILFNDGINPDLGVLGGVWFGVAGLCVSVVMIWMVKLEETRMKRQFGAYPQQAAPPGQWRY